MRLQPRMSSIGFSLPIMTWRPRSSAMRESRSMRRALSSNARSTERSVAVSDRSG